MGKVLGIVRASTETQEVDSQKKELRDYLSKLGYSDGDMVFIEEQGASARKCNKKYLRFLEDIKTAILSDGEINAVGLWSLNRLGRVESKLHEMKEFFVKHRIQVYCKEPNFKLLKDDGTEDTAGGMMFSVYAAMVKLDTDEMMAKMVRGKHRNSKVGKFNGGSIVKFGYKVNGDGYIVVNAEEASLVQLVFKMYSSGKFSVSSLARELNERGIKQRGKSITHDWVNRTLNCCCYIGKPSPRDNSNVILPRIIEQDLWDKVNSVAKGKFKGEVPTSRESKNCNLCVGLIKCPRCGSRLCAKDGRYICVWHTKGECPNSNGVLVNAMDMMAYDVARLLELDSLQDPSNELIDELKEKIAVTLAKIETAEHSKDDFQAKKSKVGDLYVDGIIDKAAYKKRLGKIDADASEIDSKIESYKKDLKTLMKQLDNAENPSIDTLIDWADDLDRLSKEKCRELVRKWVQSIHFNEAVVNGYKSKVVHIATIKGDWVFVYRYKKRPYEIWHKVGNRLVKHYPIDHQSREGMSWTDVISQSDKFTMEEEITQWDEED